MDLERPIEPHPAKAILKSHGVSLGQAARFCRCSYYHLSHILSGTCKPGKRIRKRLDDLVKHLKKKETNDAREDA